MFLSFFGMRGRLGGESHLSKVVDRHAEFAPVKNADGAGSTKPVADSPTSARNLLWGEHQRWMAIAKIGDKPIEGLGALPFFDSIPIEVSPMAAYVLLL
jgi:hypothetical protein